MTRKNSSKKSSPGEQSTSPRFSPEQYAAIVEDATVDAHGLEEELESWAAYLEDELQFPFEVSVVGQPGQVTKVDVISERVKVAFEIGGNEYWVDVPEVEGTDGTSNNSLLFAIYCAWLGGGISIPEHDSTFIR